ncbi:hypothetical protein A374_06701 [Fictibacillus macauensis ZFHKF-1]|uniref:Lipoprotein n=1 Tax=Fictibacillus macauensis ZFHKF-1 TaxID=1196324 RepID=I8UHG9_9BACL|nr:hypothetical protein [Fictibacillus macauensis]EIT86268.1 hypothetical protein A374_06701 [Fictibacillus macauensis ZFHKF-1]
MKKTWLITAALLSSVALSACSSSDTTKKATAAPKSTESESKPDPAVEKAAQEKKEFDSYLNIEAIAFVQEYQDITNRANKSIKKTNNRTEQVAYIKKTLIPELKKLEKLVKDKKYKSPNVNAAHQHLVKIITIDREGTEKLTNTSNPATFQKEKAKYKAQNNVAADAYDRAIKDLAITHQIDTTKFYRVLLAGK